MDVETICQACTCTWFVTLNILEALDMHLYLAPEYKLSHLAQFGIWLIVVHVHVNEILWRV